MLSSNLDGRLSALPSLIFDESQSDAFFWRQCNDLFQSFSSKIFELSNFRRSFADSHIERRQGRKSALQIMLKSSRFTYNTLHEAQRNQSKQRSHLKQLVLVLAWNYVSTKTLFKRYEWNVDNCGRRPNLRVIIAVDLWLRRFFRQSFIIIFTKNPISIK